MENNQMKRKEAEQKKQRRKIVLWSLAALVVLLLAVMPMLAARNDNGQEQTASILSGVVEKGSIDTRIIGGGQLASEAAVKLKIPEEVKLTEYLVGNGDTVKQGDAIARVDRVSVMTAITGVQETLDELSKEIADAENDKPADTVKAKVGGTVKVLYAREGDSVQDVMLRYGALAAISLDDIMAVQIATASGLDAGDSIRILFSQGKETEGRIVQNLEGVLTITMDDDDYPVGSQVTVLSETGELLGQGELYIYNQWNAMAYSGTVSRVLVSEGKTLYSGQAIFRLEDSGHTAEFQRLIDKRQEYEKLMQELFQMYRTEIISAPCDGIVTGVDKDGAYLLADRGGSFAVRLLSAISGGEEGFVGCPVQVEAVSETGMQLRMGRNSVRVTDLAQASDIGMPTSGMKQQWNYTGSAGVYTQDDDGLLTLDGTAQPGDILIAVGNDEGVLWFIRAEQTAGVSRTAFGGTVGIHSLSNEGTGIQLSAQAYQGMVGEVFSASLQASVNNQPITGLWGVVSGALPAGLSLAENGAITGTPTVKGDYTVTVGFQAEGYDLQTIAVTISIGQQTPEYTAVAALVTAVQDGVLIVKQGDPVAVADPTKPPQVTVDQESLKQDAPYLSNLIKQKDLSEGDVLLLVLDKDGKLYSYSILSKSQENPGNNPGQGGAPGTAGGMPSGGGSGMSGFGGGMTGGMTQEEDDGRYSLEKLTIASVTSQEHMTVEITIDELDITRIYVGQAATVTVNALGGERFAATVTQIANTGENEGGNSKFTVELTLEKSGDMLPGMTASAWIVLDTAQDVLCIPAAALTKENGKTVVYTSYDPEEGVLGAPVEITIGRADADNVQVLSGLEEGETFYYAYYETIDSVAMPPMGAMPFG